MAFNSAEYRKRIVKAYASNKQQKLAAAIRELNAAASPVVPAQIDLLEFYGLEPGLSDRAIADQIECVANDLSKLAIGAPGALMVAGKAMLAFHRRLEELHPNLRSRAFWDRIVAGRTQAAERRLEEFSRNVVSESGALRALTEERLRELATLSGLGGEVTDVQLKEKVVAAGGVVVSALPPLSAVSNQLRNEIRDGLRATSRRSVLSAIFLKQGEPQTFTLLDGFRSSDSPGLKLTVGAVVDSYDRSQQAKDTDENVAIGKVLLAIKTAITSDSALHDLVVAAFLDVGSQIAKEVPLPGQALDEFVRRTGIERSDAVRILVNLSGTKTTPLSGYAEVTEALAEGAVRAARRLYESRFAAMGRVESPDQKQAVDALKAVEEWLEKLLSTAAVAIAKGDVEQARKAVQEARTLCDDDPAVDDMARRVPPSVPVKAIATPAEGGHRVRVAWEPGLGDTAAVRYHVVRKVGVAPANATDGTVVVRSTSDLSVIDSEPPLAVSVHYGVSAVREDRFSPLCAASIRLLPPVRDVRVSCEPTAVHLRWSAVAAVRAVEVVQVAPDGVTCRVPSDPQMGATAARVVTGQTYTYLITAIYTGPDGVELRSETVRERGVPRGQAAVVETLSLAERAGAGGVPELEASWPAVNGYVVEVWHFARCPAWGIRSRVPMDEVRSHGTQVTGRQLSDGARQAVRGPLGAGLRYYLAITRDGNDALVGASQAFGSCPSVTDVVVERFNDEARLRWTWPGDSYEVLVRWKASGGHGERRMSRSVYLENGCRVQIGAGRAVFTFTTVAGDATTTWSSSETTYELPPASLVVRYEVQFRRRMLLPPRLATLIFSGAGVNNVDVIVVGARGRVMPHDESSGVVLANVRLNPVANASLDVSLPSGSGPLWIRAFSKTPGIRLGDPPPSQMRLG